MKKHGTEFKLKNLENLLYQTLTHIISFIFAFIVSRAQFNNEVAPFSLSIFAICPNIGLKTLSYYIGSFIGFISKPFSIYNFKYILANSILFIFISIFGPKHYKTNIYSPLLPSTLCLLSGALFLFIENFSIITIVLLVCESILCGCTSYFVEFCFIAFKRRCKLTSKDIISINITLIIIVCSLNQYDIYNIPLSILFIILFNYLTCYLFDVKSALLFNISICALPAILNPENGIYFILLYLPTCVSSMVSNYGKKHVFLSYFLTYSIVYITNFISLPIVLIFAPILSGTLFYILPKDKLETLLNDYIDLKVCINNGSEDNKIQIYEKFIETSGYISKMLDNISIKPIINTKNENRIKRYLHLNRCRDTKITNYYNKSGKQIISVMCKTDGTLSLEGLKNKMISVCKRNLIMTENSSDRNFINCKFEQSYNFKVECYALCKAKKGETVCGDTITAFKSNDDKYYIILADGMGCGKDAYTKSNDAIILLKKILYAGGDIITSIETVNSSLEMLRDDIGFSTIDICCVSLVDGESLFVKCGAYKSYIIRNGKINTINGGGFPAGLESEVSYISKSFQLKNRDIIVMMSDGLAFTEEQIQATILMNKHDDIESLAKNIIDTAINNTQKDFDDDMTVLVSKIIKRNVE